jgi:AcrR family transcriptional regulator
MSRRPRRIALGPRKTATQTRATKTVEAIIEAAARILETLGFEGYTTNAIAKRAGVSIGSLYQYFPNKDAITLALIERESGILLHEVLEAAVIEDWREALNQMVDAAVRHQLRRPTLARLLDVEEARLPAGDDATGGGAAIRAAVQGLIARGAFDKPYSIGRVTGDVIAITRGITDMAGRLGESGAEDLKQRVHRAVLGYLLGASRTGR